MTFKMRLQLSALAMLALGAASSPAFTQGAGPTGMTFFVTSAGSGKGADLGGLEGADRHCQTLAQAAGAASQTWRAYLSASAVGGQKVVNARDGKRPRRSAEHA